MVGRAIRARVMESTLTRERSAACAMHVRGRARTNQEHVHEQAMREYRAAHTRSGGGEHRARMLRLGGAQERGGCWMLLFLLVLTCTSAVTASKHTVSAKHPTAQLAEANLREQHRLQANKEQDEEAAESYRQASLHHKSLNLVDLVQLEHLEFQATLHTLEGRAQIVCRGKCNDAPEKFFCINPRMHAGLRHLESWQEQLPKAEGKKIFRRKAEVTGCDASLCQAWSCHVYHHTQGPNIADLKISCKGPKQEEMEDWARANGNGASLPQVMEELQTKRFLRKRSSCSLLYYLKSDPEQRTHTATEQQGAKSSSVTVGAGEVADTSDEARREKEALEALAASHRAELQQNEFEQNEARKAERERLKRERWLKEKQEQQEQMAVQYHKELEQKLKLKKEELARQHKEKKEKRPKDGSEPPPLAFSAYDYSSPVSRRAQTEKKRDDTASSSKYWSPRTRDLGFVDSSGLGLPPPQRSIIDKKEKISDIFGAKGGGSKGSKEQQLRPQKQRNSKRVGKEKQHEKRQIGEVGGVTGNGDELGDSKPHAQGATGDWLRDSGAFWKALGNSMWLSGLGRQEQKATLPYESVVRAWEVYGEPYQREILMFVLVMLSIGTVLWVGWGDGMPIYLEEKKRSGLKKDKNSGIRSPTGSAKGQVRKRKSTKGSVAGPDKGSVAQKEDKVPSAQKEDKVSAARKEDKGSVVQKEAKEHASWKEDKGSSARKEDKVSAAQKEDKASSGTKERPQLPLTVHSPGVTKQAQPETTRDVAPVRMDSPTTFRGEETPIEQAGEPQEFEQVSALEQIQPTDSAQLLEKEVLCEVDASMVNSAGKNTSKSTGEKVHPSDSKSVDAYCAEDAVVLVAGDDMSKMKAGKVPATAATAANCDETVNEEQEAATITTGSAAAASNEVEKTETAAEVRAAETRSDESHTETADAPEEGKRQGIENVQESVKTGEMEVDAAKGAAEARQKAVEEQEKILFLEQQLAALQNAQAVQAMPVVNQEMPVVNADAGTTEGNAAVETRGTRARTKKGAPKLTLMTEDEEEEPPLEEAVSETASPSTQIKNILGIGRQESNRSECSSSETGSTSESKALDDDSSVASSRAPAPVAPEPSAPPTGLPHFRKRKPRKDLDLSACDPVGYFNGSNGNMNLCFMNAALQLLLHAMRDLADDLNRCDGAVALSLREWVEAVLECGRTYTPGTTPKYIKTSPKYTLVGSAGAHSSANHGSDCLLMHEKRGENGGGLGVIGRALRVEKSEKLRAVLSKHLRIIAQPSLQQSQCDSYEFLEGVLETLRADVAACAMDKTSQKSLQDLTNFMLKNMEEDSLRGEAGDWSYLRNLSQLADLKWQADALGTYQAPGAVALNEKSQPRLEADRHRPVSFIGQMMTSTWDRKKAAFTGCDFEPFHVWVLSLRDCAQGGEDKAQRDSTSGVMLEDLLENYCRESQPEGATEGIFRTTLIWRLPATLIFCMRRFRFEVDEASKLDTAVDIPMVLDFACDSGRTPVCHHSRARNACGAHLADTGRPPAEAAARGKELLALLNDFSSKSGQEGQGGGGSRARRKLGNSCVHRTLVPSFHGNMWESPATVECREFCSMYDLTGVCYHLGGSLESGHYVAAVKGPNDQWWECNDEQCVPVAAEDVPSGRTPTVRMYEGESTPGKSRTAYVLVYHRRR